MDRDPGGLQRCAEFFHVRGGDRPTEGVRVAVLNNNKACDRRVRVGCVLNCVDYGVNRHLAVRQLVHWSKSGASDNGVVRRLVVRDVPFSGGDDFAAARDMRHHTDQVPHRSRGHEEPRLLAEQVGGTLF